MLNITQWNVRSFTKNKPFICSAIDRLSPNILCLQETNAKKKQELNLPGYICAARKDRDEGSGGGVAIFTQKHLATTNIKLRCDEIEATGICIHLENHKLNIISIYLPPNLGIGKIEENLDKLLAELKDPYIICLDANAHHPSWGSPNADRRGELMTDLTEKYEATIINNGEPTFLSNTWVEYYHTKTTR